MNQESLLQPSWWIPPQQPKNWSLLCCCCHLKAVLWRFLKFRCRMGYTYRDGKVRFNRRAAALGSCHPSALAGSRAGRWQEAKSELQNQEMNTLTGVTQGRQQVPPVSGSNDPQDLGGGWRGTQEEPPKDCRGTKEAAWAQHCHTQGDQWGWVPTAGDGQTTPFLQEISECHSRAGWIKYTSATGATEQPVHAWDTIRSKAATRSMWDRRNDHRNTNTVWALCSATAQKAFGFSKSTKDSNTWKKLGSAHRNLHISVKFSKNKISARSFQVRKISLRIQVNDKRQMPGETGRPPTLHTCHWQHSVTSSWERTALVRHLKRNGDLGATSCTRSSWMCYFWGPALLWAMGCSARHTPFPDTGRTKQTARA